MKISREEIDHLATLSRLRFSGAEVEEIGTHLDNIIERFKELEKVDVSSVPPTAHILPFTNVLREDEAKESTARETLLSNAPETDGETYIVPRVVE
ncbi:MAG: Asp-tRNA(Asn)/Glu-tRNA(Gln) amidotransferase subunit GatC [Christensenellales bacterium]